MKRLALAFLLALCFAGASPAEAKTCRTVSGLFASLFAPMQVLKAEVSKRCAKTLHEPWWAVSNAKVDIDFGHSMGADAILRTSSKRKISIDPTLGNTGCPKWARCTNFHNPMNAFPMVVCCGGYAVRGAKNIVAPYPHVSMPDRIAKRAVDEGLR